MVARALHVIPAVAPRYGGPSAATFGMCQALRGIGIDTLVATTDADGADRLAVPLEQVQDYHGIPMIFFRRYGGEAYKWSRHLASWLDAHVSDADVVHIHAVFSHASIAAGRACRARRVPYIVRPLGTLDPWSLDQKRLRKRLLLRAGAYDLLRGAAAMHYTSADEGRLAQSAISGLPRGVVVPIGIDDACFPAGTDDSAPDAPYLLTLSRLDVKKGLNLLIGAFHEIAADATLASWRLVIAGEGSAAYVEDLRALAANGAAAARIEFRGWVSGPAKQALFRHAHLFALPSQQENFGIAVAEAMAAGVPVVVTPGVNLATDIREAGAGWVVERDLASIVAGLRTAMHDAVARERRGIAGRQLAHRFRWPTVAAELREMYEGVCAA